MIYDLKFDREKKRRVKGYLKDKKFVNLSKKFNIKATINNYAYNFNWLGVPIIQFPQDLVVMQELIFDIKPDLIIETGIARGGSLVFYASLLKLINPKAKVLGIDIDIRPHTKKVFKKHSLRKRILSIKGSSVSKNTIEKTKKITK